MELDGEHIFPTHRALDKFDCQLIQHKLLVSNPVYLNALRWY